MQMLIDRETRDAIHDDCRSEIEGFSDLKLDDLGDRALIHELWLRLRYIGPLLDQIGWEPQVERDRFELRFDARRMRTFLRRHLAGWRGCLEDSVTTPEDLRASFDRAVQLGWPMPSEEEFADEVAALRASVDEILDTVAVHRRLLDVIDLASRPATVEAVA